MNEIEKSADIRIYDYKNKKVYTEKSLVICDTTKNKIIAAGNECEDYIRQHISPDLKLYTPIELGQITDFDMAQKMFQILLDRHLGKKCLFRKRGVGLLFLHEEYSGVERRPYEDLIYLMGYGEVWIADEHIMEKSDTMSWEDVIWKLDTLRKGIYSAIEITKEDPHQYAKYALEQYLKRCDHWGVEREEIKDWF